MAIDGRSVQVPVNKQTLQSLADGTNGRAYTAESGDELRDVYAQIGTSLGYRVVHQEITQRFIIGRGHRRDAGGGVGPRARHPHPLKARVTFLAVHYFDERPQAESRPATVTLVLPDLHLRLETDRGVFSPDRVDTGTRILLESVPPRPPRATCSTWGAATGRSRSRWRPGRRRRPSGPWTSTGGHWSSPSATPRPPALTK